VRLIPPELVKVSDKFKFFPICTLPNARLAGFAARVPCVTPVPERGIVKLESEPVETMVAVPLMVPLAVGENTTVNEVLWPAVKVTGKDSPVKANADRLVLAAEIVRLVPPVLVRVPLNDFDVPSCTFPNPKLVGFAVNAPCATPVPVRGIVKLELDPLEVILTAPLAAPGVVGEKRTANDVLWPALNVKGKVSPLRLYPLPLAAAAETVRLAPPELVRVTDCVWFVPTWTLPKFTLLGLGVS
jgi:hypothetical protein